MGCIYLFFSPGLPCLFWLTLYVHAHPFQIYFRWMHKQTAWWPKRDNLHPWGVCVCHTNVLKGTLSPLNRDENQSKADFGESLVPLDSTVLLNINSFISVYCCQVHLLKRAQCESRQGQSDYLTMFNRYLIKHKSPGRLFEEEVNTPEILIIFAIQSHAIVKPQQHHNGNCCCTIGHFPFPPIFTCSVWDKGLFKPVCNGTVLFISLLG